MELYLYFVCRADGVAISLDAREFAGDAAAARHGRVVCDAHPTCESVTVNCGERLVAVCQRRQADSASPRLVVDRKVAGIETAQRS